MKRNNYTLLVVEPAETITGAIRETLGESEIPRFEILGVSTLAQAVEMLSTRETDFIVLDMELPDGSGEELIGYLIALELPELPKIIVLTNAIDHAHRTHLFQLGIIDYLLKTNPVNFLAQELLKSIRQTIAHHESRILIADTSEHFTEYAAAVLRNQNYGVEICSDQDKIVRHLQTGTFHLFIADLGMVGGEELALLRTIRRDTTLMDIPIIGLGETTHPETVARLLKSGGNDFLPKPVDIESLLPKIDALIAIYKKQLQLVELNTYLEREVQKSVEAIRTKDHLLELENRHAQTGRLIGALTHQWKQPLNAIGLAADFIGQTLPEASESSEMILVLKEQVRFLADTMNHFRRFFKPAGYKEPFSVVNAIQDVLKLLGETYLSLNISVEGDAALRTLGYPNEFHQVVINLLNNAQDAYEEKKIPYGKVTVSVRRENGRIIMTCRDEAGGIPESIITNLFDQYVSTKGEKGTGIGLHMSRAIIRKIGGSITVDNWEQGTRFTLNLPLADPLRQHHKEFAHD